MDADPYPALLLTYFFDFFGQKPLFLQAHIAAEFSASGLFFAALILLVLLLCTALVAASEVAFLGMSPVELNEIRKENTPFSERMQRISEKPHYLLATLLVAINFINIAIILVLNNVLETFFEQYTIDFRAQYAIEVFIEIFVLVLFGEIMPKVYASSNKGKVAQLMALPMLVLRQICYPINFLMVKSTELIETYIIKGEGGSLISQEDIGTAIDLTVKESDHAKQDKDLLKSIVKFGNVAARQIMRSRMDVITLHTNDTFLQILDTVREYGYSRLPVIGENEDDIQGIILVKNLLPHLNEAADFDWHKLITPAFFVPETRKIDNILRDFQERKVHLAIVIDEYGVAVGIVTLEDILEEIVGEIQDEFDDSSDVLYEKIDDSTYIFEAKIMLNDVCRALALDTETFAAVRGDADSLAGLIINLVRRIPRVKDIITHDVYQFEILQADQRRISKVKMTILLND
jgi:putative hemolysin